MMSLVTTTAQKTEGRKSVGICPAPKTTVAVTTASSHRALHCAGEEGDCRKTVTVGHLSDFKLSRRSVISGKGCS